MEMRIVVSEAGGASALVQKLSVLLGSDRVALWGERNEVGVRIEGNTERVILRVLDAVDGWLDQAAGRSAQMRLGQHSYTMAR